VRDLVAIGFRVEDVALWALSVCKEADVTPRVNVVEVVAPEDAQLLYERLLDEKRGRPYVLRIHPVADLVCTLEQWTALQKDLAVELRTGGYDPPDDGDTAAAEDEAEPFSPFDIDSLAEVIRETVGQGVGTIHASGRNLVALAAPATQLRIADFLDDLRSNTEEFADGLRR
jgi:hypothetical protein